MESEFDDKHYSEENDAIGDTVYSKHWLIKCLRNTLKVVNDEAIQSSQSAQPLELDENCEQQLCILWDMSTDQSVAQQLVKFDAIDLFSQIIVNTNCPRLAEISCGILANMATNDDICVIMASKQQFRELILSLLQSSDTPFVLQLIRIISTSFSNSCAKLMWSSSISSNYNQFFPTIQFIFENCLNCDLLKAVLALLYKILYADDSICLKWLKMGGSGDKCVYCLVEASQQLIQQNIDNIQQLDYFWLILHLLSLCCEQFLSTHIDPIGNLIFDIFKQYIISTFGNRVDYTVSQHRAGCLAASLVICNHMIASPTIKSELKSNSELMACFKNLMINCDQNVSSERVSNIECYELAIIQLRSLDHSLNV